jgi:hypothetical protein
MRERSGFCLLVAAHDRVWNTALAFDVKRRTCELLWRLAILVSREPVQYIEMEDHL